MFAGFVGINSIVQSGIRKEISIKNRGLFLYSQIQNTQFLIIGKGIRMIYSSNHNIWE